MYSKEINKLRDQLKRDPGNKELQIELKKVQTKQQIEQRKLQKQRKAESIVLGDAQPEEEINLDEIRAELKGCNNLIRKGMQDKELYERRDELESLLKKHDPDIQEDHIEHFYSNDFHEKIEWNRTKKTVKFENGAKYTEDELLNVTENFNNLETIHAIKSEFGAVQVDSSVYRPAPKEIEFEI